jgi:nicotinamide riboside transporter PnuC
MKKETKKNEEKYGLSLAMQIVMVVVFFLAMLIESLLALAILLALFFLFVLCDYKLQETRKRGKKP